MGHSHVQGNLYTISGYRWFGLVGLYTSHCAPKAPCSSGTFVSVCRRRHCLEHYRSLRPTFPRDNPPPLSPPGVSQNRPNQEILVPDCLKTLNRSRDLNNEF
eukprot:sb/3478337/